MTVIHGRVVIEKRDLMFLFSYRFANSANSAIEIENNVRRYYLNMKNMFLYLQPGFSQVSCDADPSHL